jgi:GT2 family glycosyltransferase
VREVLCGIVTAALMLGDGATARAALGKALSGFAPDPTLIALANRVTGQAGWCGLTDDGVLAGAAVPARVVTLDGAEVTPGANGALTAGWMAAKTLAVTRHGSHLPGSPIDIAGRVRTEGFVELTTDGIAGWAWHPAAPETDPVLSVLCRGKTWTVRATDPEVALSGATPLARPRGFAVRCDTQAPVRVLGRDGRDLWGSPLGGVSVPAAAPAPRPGGGTAVIIPVYRDARVTLACVRSVLRTAGADDVVLVVDDASPDADLRAALRALADTGAISLLAANPAEPARNVGFPRAANTGLLAAGGRDCVLLNSDTVVFPGWLPALRQAAHSAADIGTVTAISNDATIFSYPDPAARSPILPPRAAAALARMAARANAGVTVEVPTGHGFCLYIRADCLHRVGLLRADLFAQGYGEENDFCERARALGYRHMAAPGVYVAHHGGISFGAAREHLLRRNLAIIDGEYPDYAGRIAAFIAADPLAPARRRIDLARLRAARQAEKGGGVILVTHSGRGGTGRVVATRAAAATARGLAPIVLRGDEGVVAVGEPEDGYPNLRYRLPDEAPALLRMLRGTRPVALEYHHLLGHPPEIVAVLHRLGLAHEVWVHDYAWLCPRLALVTGEARFCGEPPVAQCDICVARWGQSFEPPVAPAVLRARNAALLAAATRVVVPAADVAARIRRHFPAAAIDVQPWEPALPPAAPRRAPPVAGGDLVVAVVGAISMTKGYDLLLDCARDAAARALPLRFHVVGFTVDDTPLLDSGQAFVTGPFKPENAGALLAGSGAAFAFLPSIWPETWCFALSDVWAAGLAAVVFDLGAPAERVRASGRGAVLPLGLPPGGVNDALLNPQILGVRFLASGAAGKARGAAPWTPAGQGPDP